MTIAWPGRALTGAVLMLGSVLIFGSNFAISRHATLNGLSAPDLVALRFGVAGLLLLPVFLARGGFADCAGLGWRRGLVLTLLSGFPLSLIMLSGIAFAPAAHGASIAPGTVTIVSAVGAFLMFGVRLTPMQIAGLGLALGGLAAIAWHGATSGSPTIWIGDVLFLATGLVWGTYPLILQRWRLDALTSTAVVCVLSLPYTLLYLPFALPHLGGLRWEVVAFHAINQGVLNTIVGLWLWAKAVELVGAGTAGRFPPLVPVIGTLVGIPVLGELPGPVQVAGIVMIVGGLLIVTIWRGRAAVPAGSTAR
jgi:drug/metabolite transporter (DMT)-like permease